VRRRHFRSLAGKTKHAFRRIFPPPGGADGLGPHRLIVARLPAREDFTAAETRGDGAATSHPTKDNRQYPAATLRSLIANVYI
jgi:hypothetical protein